MNRVAIGLFCLVTLGQVGFSQMATIGQPSDLEVATAIAMVKNMPASKLDRRLSGTRLEDWLQTQGGAGARINWAYEQAAEPWASLRCVQAVVSLGKDQSFLVSIDVSQDARHPSFESGWVVVRRGQIVELERLSDLPHLLSKLRETSQNAIETRS